MELFHAYSILKNVPNASEKQKTLPVAFRPTRDSVEELRVGADKLYVPAGEKSEASPLMKTLAEVP